MINRAVTAGGQRGDAGHHEAFHSMFTCRLQSEGGDVQVVPQAAFISPLT